MILCWVAFTAILGCVGTMGWTHLEQMVDNLLNPYVY